MAKLLVAFLLGLAMAPIGSAARAADETVALITRVYIAPGQEAAYEERARRLVEYVRKAEPGVIYRHQRSKKDPSIYVYYEVFPSPAALENHAKVVLPTFNKEFGARPEGMFSRPPELEWFQPIEN